MSIRQEDLDQHLKSVVDEGFEINPPDFAQLGGWNDILTQSMMAKHFIARLQTLENKLGDVENAFDHAGLFAAFLVTYGKCFNSAGSHKVTLDGKDVFKDADPAVGLAHSRIMELRNTYAAHNSNSGLVVNTIAVKRGAEDIVLRHITTTAIPQNEFEGFGRAVATLEQYVVIRLNRILAKMESRMRKQIVLD